MEFHPEKCQVLSITRSRNPVRHGYKFKGEVLKHIDSAKYLGVEISSEMKWDKHINNTVNKGNRIHGFLKRNIRPYSQDLKSKAYKVIVGPTLEYASASAILDPYTKKRINTLEMIQHRAARYVKNRYERYARVTEMLRELQWDSLEEKRRRQRLIKFYNIHHHQVEVMKDAYIKQSSNLRPSRFILIAKRMKYQGKAHNTTIFHFSTKN